MNKAIWGVLGALIVIVLGFFFVMKMGNQSTTQNTTSTTATTESPSPTSTESATPESQMVITYTDSGFTPKTLTVKMGDTVTFTNDSSLSMWVASNPHPAHTGYAGFDAKTGMSKGESYTFTFTKAGTWGFHNHLHATDGGTITVQ